MTQEAQAPSAPFTLHHIGIVTPPERFDQTVATVLGALGGVIEEEGGDDELDMRGVWIQAGGIRLEIVTPRSDADGPMTRFLARSGDGLHHVSFETGALETCKQLARESGASIIGESDDHAGWAEYFLHPHQTGGALLHWMQKI